MPPETMCSDLRGAVGLLSNVKYCEANFNLCKRF